MRLFAAAIAAAIVFASPALADLKKVESQQEFVTLVKNKTLTRPLI